MAIDLHRPDAAALQILTITQAQIQVCWLSPLKLVCRNCRATALQMARTMMSTVCQQRSFWQQHLQLTAMQLGTSNRRLRPSGEQRQSRLHCGPAFQALKVPSFNTQGDGLTAEYSISRSSMLLHLLPWDDFRICRCWSAFKQPCVPWKHIAYFTLFILVVSQGLDACKQ